jgi:hypothetical protein
MTQKNEIKEKVLEKLSSEKKDFMKEALENILKQRGMEEGSETLEEDIHKYVFLDHDHMKYSEALDYFHHIVDLTIKQTIKTLDKWNDNKLIEKAIDLTLSLSRQKGLGKEADDSAENKRLDEKKDDNNETIIDKLLDKSYEETIIPQDALEDALKEARADERAKCEKELTEKIYEEQQAIADHVIGMNRDAYKKRIADLEKDNKALLSDVKNLIIEKDSLEKKLKENTQEVSDFQVKELLKWIDNPAKSADIAFTGGLIRDVARKVERQLAEKDREIEDKLLGSDKQIVVAYEGKHPTHDRCESCVSIGFEEGQKDGKDFELQRILSIIDNQIGIKSTLLERKSNFINEDEKHRCDGGLETLQDLKKKIGDKA